MLARDEGAARATRGGARRPGAPFPMAGRHLPGRAAGLHQRRADRAVALGERLRASQAGASRVADRPRKLLDVVADRFRIGNGEGARDRGGSKPRSMPRCSAAVVCSTSFRVTRRGRRNKSPQLSGASRPAGTAPTGDRRYADPQPALFSFNSAFGACETCRGFGRVIGVDWGLVIPDEKKTLRRRDQDDRTPAWKEIQADLLKVRRRGRHPARHGVEPALAGAARLGDRGRPGWNGHWNKRWYGIRRFFGYLETRPTRCTSACSCRSTTLHDPPGTCGGARLKPIVAVAPGLEGRGRRR